MTNFLFGELIILPKNSVKYYLVCIVKNTRSRMKNAELANYKGAVHPRDVLYEDVHNAFHRLHGQSRIDKYVHNVPVVVHCALG